MSGAGEVIGDVGELYASTMSGAVFFENIGKRDIVQENRRWTPSDYYNALDGLVLPNGQTISRGDLELSFMGFEEMKKIYPKMTSAGNAHYLGLKDGKHHVNFNISDYEETLANIRAVAVHEIYGHGIMNYGEATKDHYKAYWASIDSKYWVGTTKAFREHTAYAMWLTWTRAGKYGGMPGKYLKVIYDYHPHYKR